MISTATTETSALPTKAIVIEEESVNWFKARKADTWRHGLIDRIAAFKRSRELSDTPKDSDGIRWKVGGLAYSHSVEWPQFRNDRDLVDLDSLEDDSVWARESEHVPQISKKPTLREAVAYVRGEGDLQCDCGANPPSVTFRHQITGTLLVLNASLPTMRSQRDIWNSPHGICVARRVYASLAKEMHPWSSNIHDRHRISTLLPHPKSPIEPKRQEQVIADLDKKVRGIVNGTQRGWVILGPPGTSKSTYVMAVLQDVAIINWTKAKATIHSKYHNDPTTRPARRLRSSPSVCIWRLRVRDWLAEMSLWETRRFDSDEKVDPPSLTVESMKEESKLFGIPPTLWLEEIDRFPVTEARLHHLFRLVDTVYELGGCVIVTANAKLPELAKRFDEAFMRRIVGTNDDGGFSLLDYWSPAK